MEIFVYTDKKNNINKKDFEVVETKGKGHPDNICDTLAEKISANYSKYCKETYGVILRHMIDKLSILGGGSKVQFGKGEMIAPIRMLVNGRFTDRYKDKKINYMQIVNDTIKQYFNELFPLLDIEKYLIIVDNTHHNEGPGVIYTDDNITKNERANFFEVKDQNDMNKHNNHYKCNDTSTTVSYYPMSDLEKTVLSIEQFLNSKEYEDNHPWVGNDIKVMGMRKKNKIEITVCVPLISLYVFSLQDYKEKLRQLKLDIENVIRKIFQDNEITIYINTRDNYENNDLYMTVIGSAIESGDEGAVGRGNRSRGVIPFSRNFSMEAACGKNPVYHTGKLFSAIGDIISEEIFKQFSLENVVYCTSKMGDEICNPWNISVELNCYTTKEIEEKIKSIVEKVVLNHQNVTNGLIEHSIKLNSY